MAKASAFNPPASPSVGDVYEFGTARFQWTASGWQLKGNASILLVGTSNMVDGSVTAAKLGSSSVTNDKLASDAVTNAKIQDSAVGTTKIAANAVTSEKIPDAGLPAAKMSSVYASVLVGRTGDSVYIVGDWRGTTGTGVLLTSLGLVDAKASVDTDYALAVRNAANARTAGIKGDGTVVGVNGLFSGTATVQNLTVNTGGVAQWPDAPGSNAHLANKAYVDSFTRVGSTIIGQGVGGTGASVTWTINVGNLFADAGPNNGSRTIKLAGGTPGTWVAHVTLAGGTVASGSITTITGPTVGTSAFTITATRVA